MTASLRPVSGTADELVPLLRTWIEGDEPLWIRTSGSTGRPKDVVLAPSAVRASADATHARLGGPGQWLLAVPPTGVAGLLGRPPVRVARAHPAAPAAGVG